MKKLTLALLLVAGTVCAQTPEPTPTPPVTPTPDPNRPPRVREDEESGLLVSAAAAPDDYYQDRDRGMVRYTSDTSNYSFQRVALPTTRPLVITDANFTQALARTPTFWAKRDQGLNAATQANPVRLLPNGHTVVAGDVGCRVRIRPSGGAWTRGMYKITGLAAGNSVWVLDKAPAPASTSGGDWQEICPVRDFTGITFTDCNLCNVWIPTALAPTLNHCQRVQGDLPPPPTPEPTPTP